MSAKARAEMWAPELGKPDDEDAGSRPRDRQAVRDGKETNDVGRRLRAPVEWRPSTCKDGVAPDGWKQEPILATGRFSARLPPSAWSGL